MSLLTNIWQSSQLTISTGFFGPLNLLGLLPMTAPLLLRDLVLPEVERLGDGHPVSRLLVAVSFLITHGERARRNQDKLDLDASTEINRALLGNPLARRSRSVVS